MFTKRLLLASLVAAVALPAFADETRLSTKELSEHLRQIAKGEKQGDYKIDEAKAALSLGQELSDFKETAGFFGSAFPHPGNPEAVVKFYDNKFTYIWSFDKDKNERAETPYVNIIAQFDGEDQPELLKYVKEGDVVVYWHPEYGSNSLESAASPDEFNQWRATHAATIVEVQKDGKTLIATADIPAGYARPFNGSGRTPGHIFRYVARDSEGNIVEGVEDYGKQIARWATMAFGRFSFNGDYGSMTIRRPNDLKGFAQQYLKPSGADIPSMYCAWYAYTNVNLGVMCPIGNCVEQNFPTEFENLQSQDKAFGFIGESGSRGYSQVMYGDGSWAEYSKGSSYNPNFSKFAIEPLTAQNLLSNFFDRVFGRDAKATSSPEAWIAHAKFKAGFLQQQGGSFASEFSIRSGRVVPTVMSENDGSGYVITSADAEAYNQAVQEAIGKFAVLYNKSAEKVMAGQSDPVTEEKAIRKKLRRLLDDERGKPQGRRWIPPYGFAAEAEAVEQDLMPEGETYFPSMVYVGTIVHYDSYLMEQDGSSQNFISPKAGLTQDARDKELSNTIIAALGLEQSLPEPPEQEPYEPEYEDCEEYSWEWRQNRCNGRNAERTRAYEWAKSEQEKYQAKITEIATQGLFDKLVSESGDDYAWGLNPFESSALLASQYHWKSDFPLDDEELLASADVQTKVKAHNNFGMDPVSMQRWLVAYWNNPKSVRATLYDVENGGKLFKLASNTAQLATLTDADAFFSQFSELLSNEERQQVAENSANDPRDAQPRLDQEIVCGGDRPATQTVPLAEDGVQPSCD